MTKEQILKKVIEKAVKNGWKFGQIYLENTKNNTDIRKMPYFVYPIIFNHSFAKAFFGEEYRAKFAGLWPKIYGGSLKIPKQELAWEYHLQQLALAKDRLKYLSKFL